MRYVRLILAAMLWVLLPGTIAARAFWDIVLDVSMTNNDFQSTTLCEASCFAATYAFSTVPFYTMNTARSVTLAYNGDRAFPRPYIFADVTPTAGTPTISRFTLQATVNGSAVTFLNGESVLNFAGSQNAVRLGGQFDASSFSTGLYPMVITVTAIHSNNTTTVRTASNQLMIVNESGSPIAKGWTLAGVQRLYLPSGGYIVTEGDGSAVKYSTLGGFAADSSKLTLESGQYVRRYPDSTAVYFSTTGTMTEIRDRLGRQSTFYYDASGRLIEIRDPMKNIGRSVPIISLSYDANGISTIRTTGHGPDKTTNIVVATDRTLQSIADPDSKTTTFGYDASKRLSTITDRQGGIQRFIYDAFSWKITTVELPQVPIDAGGASTTLANPTIGFTPWQDKVVPRTSTASLPKATLAPGDVSANITDPEGRITSFTPDRFGQALTFTDQLLRVTTVVRSGIFATQVTNLDGSVDRFTYVKGLLSSYKLGGDSTVAIQRGAAGQIQSISGPGVPAETRLLNSDGSIANITYPDGSKSIFSYDASTKQISTWKDPKSHTTTYSYDPIFGNLSQTSAPGSRGTSITYDTYGRDSVTTVTGLAPTSTIYDAVNRPVSVYDGMNANPTTITYNETTHERSVQDPKGTIHKEETNLLGWITKRYDASGNGSYVSFRYSKGGLLKSTTNRRNQRLDYAYDELGRITAKTGQNTRPESFSYSADGNLLVAKNDSVTDSLFINPMGLSDSTVTWVGGKRFRIYHKLAATLNDLDSTLITSTTGVTFPARTFSWNSDGALAAVNVAGFGDAGFTYSTDLERTTTLWPGRIKRPESYTTIHRPYDAGFSDAGIAAQLRRAYRYDVAGRIDTEQRNNGTNTRQRTFAYDGLGRLTQVEYRNQPCNVWPTAASVDTTTGWRYTCASPDSTATYTYDAAGNRTDRNAVLIGGNRYQSFNSASYAYDADGNVIQKYDPSRFNRQFFWSAENRLDSIIQDGWSRVRYIYNAFGQPVIKMRGDPNGMHVDRYFIWDGEELFTELDASFNRVADYAYAGIDQPVAAVVGATNPSSVRWHVQDELGNVIGHFEGNLVNQTVDYDPWGTPAIGISADSRLFWKGLMWEGDVVSLYHMRNRWYDPESGRFLSEDPISVLGFNQYQFGPDDPINARDPLGTDWSCQQYLPPSHQTVVYGTVMIVRDIAGYVRCNDTGQIPEGGGSPSGLPRRPIGGQAGGGGGGGGGGGLPAENGDSLKARYMQCLKDDPALPYVSPFSFTALVNLKTRAEWRRGASRWTTIDRRLPTWLMPEVERGAQVIRGTAGRVKWLGRYGTISIGLTAFATAYSVTAMARCYDESR